jgi:hypothetical protein
LLFCHFEPMAARKQAAIGLISSPSVLDNQTKIGAGY